MFSYITTLDSLMCAALYLFSGDFPERGVHNSGGRIRGVPLYVCQSYNMHAFTIYVEFVRRVGESLYVT